MAIGGTEIAKLFATISADTKDFTSALKKADSDLNTFQKGMNSASAAMGTALKIGAAAAAAGIATLGAGMLTTTRAAANMEQAIANIAAVMGLSSEQTAKLKTLITDLGLDPKLKVSATEAAAAIEMLGRNGLTMDQILQGAARSTILLANSTGADFATAADIATDVMAQFNIAAGDMDKAVNGIMGVTKSSKFSIDDYRLAIAQAGGVASSVGVSFGDFNATIAAISPLFASGSDAGTSFKVFLQRLVPSSKTAEDAMRDLGLITADGANQFFTASGQMKGMDEIAGILKRALGGLSEQQKNQAASTIFGTDAMRAAFGLMNAGQETILEYKKNIGDTSAEDAAAIRMNTLAGQWEIFTGVVETLTIGIGDKFLPLARRLVEWTTDMASKYGPPLVDWIGNLTSKIEFAIDNWSEFSAGFAQYQPILVGVLATGKQMIEWIGSAIGKWVSWKDVLIAAAAILGGVVLSSIVSFVAAISPLLALLASVTAAVALLRKSWENDWGGIRTFTQQMLNSLLQGMAQFLAKYFPSWKGDWKSTVDYFTTGDVTRKLSNFFKYDIPTMVARMVQDAKLFVGGWVDWTLRKWNDMKNNAIETTRNWWSGVKQEAMHIINTWIADIDLKFSNWWTIQKQEWGKFKDRVVKIWDDWFGWFKPAEWLQEGKDIIQGLWDGFKQRWTLFWEWAQQRWADLRDGFKRFFGISSPSTVFAEFGRNLMEGLRGGIAAAAPGVLGAMDELSSRILSSANALGVSLEGSLAQVAGRVTALQNHLSELKRLEQVGAAQIAAYQFPAISAGVQKNTQSSASTPAQSTPQISIADTARRFAQDVFELGKNLDYQTQAASGFLSSSFGQAYSALTDYYSDSDRVLAGAIFELVGVLKKLPGGNQFQVNLAGTQTGDVTQDLSSALQYLTALYAS